MESPMTHAPKHNTSNDHTSNHAHEDLIQLVIQHGPDAIAAAFTKIMNTAMLIERQQDLGVGPYQRSDHRTAYANGTKPKALRTPVGTLTLDVPKPRPRNPPSPAAKKTSHPSIPRPSNAAPVLAAPSSPPSRRCTSRA